MADLKISALTASTTPLAGTEVLPIVQSSTTKQVSVANLTAGRAVSALSYASTTGATFATTSGNVGIGATVPAAALSFSKGEGETSGIVIGHPNWANSYYSGIYGNVTNGASNTQGFLKFATRRNAADATLTDSIFIGSNGGTSISNTWVDPGDNGLSVAGNIVIATSGKGIDFSATAGTGTSELLADYEEGTWSPVVVSTAGSITSYTASGTYTKIGRVVNLNVDITISNNGTGSGQLDVSNLPFATKGAYCAAGSFAERGAVGFGGYLYAITTAQVFLASSVGAYPGGTGYRIVGSISYPT